MSRRKPHPAKAIIVGNGDTIREVAADEGVNEHTLGRILNGYVDPWPGLSAGLAERYKVPESDLWHDSEAVAS